MVYNDYELLGERSCSKEVAMNSANFVIRDKAFFLRYLRRTCGFFRWLVSPSGGFFATRAGVQRRKKSAEGMISAWRMFSCISKEIEAEAYGECVRRSYAKRARRRRPARTRLTNPAALGSAAAS